MEDLDPGLQGYSDSGSDFHDLPEPELPKGLGKRCLKASVGAGTLKRPQDGHGVVLRCRPCPAEWTSYLDPQGLLRFDLGDGAWPQWLHAAVRTLRLYECAEFQGPEMEPVQLTLVEWQLRCDLFEDGTAIKSVLQRPEDRRRPVIGQICRVSLSLEQLEPRTLLWTRDLQYEIVDLPPPESEHRFHGAPPEGWKLLDKALLSMRRGERSEVRCTGPRLHEGVVPLPLLPLPEGDERRWLLTMLLEDFIETSDASFEQDRSVVLKSLHSRDANMRCEALGRCELRVEPGYPGPLCALLGTGELCDALECSVLRMREHDLAEVTADAKLCDWRGEKSESVTFQVEVTSYLPGDWEHARGDEEKLEVLARRKDAAVGLLKTGRYGLAAFHFREIALRLGYIDDFRGLKAGEARAAQVRELKEACWLNRALCLIKASNFKGAQDACDQALEFTSGDRRAKAYLRRAQAKLGLDDCAAALQDCLCVDGECAREAQQVALQAARRQKLLDAEAKPLAARMCSALGQLPHPLDVD
ncbi:unnamed protein product [Durusdinium trenchii]|uniref:Peptidylprolyl isomerase n=1 Tax=Durusdinium trenchii TaxID=1381693 RepID=A0ABP0KRJ8_9DINO